MRRRSDHERSSISSYLREIRRFPVLSCDEERAVLDRIAEGDAMASGRLVEHNLGFVVKVASEYRGMGVPFEDLVNEGNLGLIEAARRFDPTRGARFITYAVWWIRKRVLHALATRSRIVTLPGARRRRLVELRRLESRLVGRLGRRPTREELAEELRVPLDEIDALRLVGAAQVSLDRPVGPDDDTPLSSLVADEDETAEGGLLDAEAAERAVDAFGRLAPREQSVLGWRLGLGGQPRLTLTEAGRRLRLSRERVRQIERRALGRLRRWLTRPERARRRKP